MFPGFDATEMRAPGPSRVLFVSSEVYPLAKTGGLADVSAALPLSLRLLGVDIRLMLPGYPQALDLLLDKKVVATFEDLPAGGRLIAGIAPDSGLPVYLYDSPALYRRGGSLYQDAQGQDWPDNHLRYAGLCHAAARVALGEADSAWRADIVHANDWHAALLPAILAARGATRPATLLTIHNMAFQGNFSIDVAADLQLPLEMFSTDGMEFFGQISFLKGGIRYADRLTTVSPNYAKEILMPRYGCGLDGALRARADDLVGILNGVDYSVWDPSRDTDLPSQYTTEDLSGKVACKAAIRQELGLDASGGPLIVFVNRLTHQKMADILLSALPAILKSGVQFVLHGQGDKSLESAFAEAAKGHAPQFAARIGYEERFARRLTAAADMSLTASRFEPCGLTTMYAMRYGALPVTRHVGGVVDTVVDAESAKAAEEGATGFVFEEETPTAMAACVHRATHWFHERDWSQVQRSAMLRDFGWKRSADRYLDLYRKLRPAAFAPPADARQPPEIDKEAA